MKENYNIKRILIPVDFSVRSKNAVEQTIPIASSKNATLILYHAYSRPADLGEYNAYEQEHRLKLKTEKVRENFNAFIKTIDGIQDVNYEVEYELGISLQKIENAFKNLDIDLLVMATHGAKGVELMWGSKTTNLIKRIKGPILVFPDGSKLQNPKRFCLAYDFHKEEQNIYALSTLKQIAEVYNAHIRIVDVRPNNYAKSEHRLKEEKKISLFLGDDISHDFESIIGSDVEKELLNYVNDFDVQLMAVMPAEHSFFEKLFHQSITELMAAQINKPLLTLVDK